MPVGRGDAAAATSPIGTTGHHAPGRRASPAIVRLAPSRLRHSYNHGGSRHRKTVLHPPYFNSAFFPASDRPPHPPDPFPPFRSSSRIRHPPTREICRHPGWNNGVNGNADRHRVRSIRIRGLARHDLSPRAIDPGYCQPDSQLSRTHLRGHHAIDRACHRVHALQVDTAASATCRRSCSPTPGKSKTTLIIITSAGSELPTERLDPAPNAGVLVRLSHRLGAITRPLLGPLVESTVIRTVFPT